MNTVKIIVFALLCIGNVSVAMGADCVVLLHGLARSASAMKPMVKPFEQAGYRVVNVNYPSRKKTVEELAPLAVKQMGIDQCGTLSGEDKVHFVTHSMGGILVRYYLEHNSFDSMGHVVMTAPPNQGSEVVDSLKDVPGYRLLNGPAGLQLGTDEDSIPSQLGAVDFSLGVIAGNKTINLILSQYLPNPDDGKVSVESTKVDGMKDFLEVPRTHPFIMRGRNVIRQAVHFIQHGVFDHSR